MIVVITGATSGIGEATAEWLIEKGHTVYSFARRIGNHSGIHYISCDITSTADIEKALQEVLVKENTIDVLINNAGMGISGALECSEETDIERIVDVNLLGLVRVTRLTIPYLRQSKGRIINVGSVAGELAIPFQSMYSATKAAVHRFSEGLYNELRPLGVFVTCVMPGDTKTAFTTNRRKNEKDAIYAARVEKSVQKMEKDEQHGASPMKVAKVIERCMSKKRPPIAIAVGFSYKLLIFLKRLLPTSVIHFILYKMYGSE